MARRRGHRPRARAYGSLVGCDDDGVFVVCELADVVRKQAEGLRFRWGCGNTVTYMWVRVYKHIAWWPDSERAVKGATYFRNGGLTAYGSCSGRGEHYTHTSPATDLNGDERESYRRTIC